MATRGRPRKNPVETGPTRTLEVEEREKLTEELKKTEDMLNATQDFAEGHYTPAIPEEVSVNKSKLRANAEHIRTVLETQTPRRVGNEAERNRMLARRKELEEKFKPIIETWKDLGAIRQDSAEYKDALRKAIERPRYEGYIAEWKELGKRLEPDDPSINNLDSFRGPR